MKRLISIALLFFALSCGNNASLLHGEGPPLETAPIIGTPPPEDVARFCSEGTLQTIVEAKYLTSGANAGFEFNFGMVPGNVNYYFMNSNMTGSVDVEVFKVVAGQEQLLGQFQLQNVNFITNTLAGAQNGDQLRVKFKTSQNISLNANNGMKTFAPFEDEVDFTLDRAVMANNSQFSYDFSTHLGEVFVAEGDIRSCVPIYMPAINFSKTVIGGHVGLNINLFNSTTPLNPFMSGMMTFQGQSNSDYNVSQLVIKIEDAVSGLVLFDNANPSHTNIYNHIAAVGYIDILDLNAHPHFKVFISGEVSAVFQGQLKNLTFEYENEYKLNSNGTMENMTRGEVLDNIQGNFYLDLMGATAF